MLGNRLAELRKNNNLTQKELAEKFGLTPKAISFYELGEREPSNQLLSNFADFFDVTTDYLLGRSNNPKKNKEEEVVDEKVKILAREANDLSDVQLDLIRSMIKEFKEHKNRE